MCQVIHGTIIQNSTGVFQRNALYLDPTVEWPTFKAVMVLTIALAISISVSVIPSVLLCLYPTRVYRYLSRFLSARKRLAITAFAEALHSCFKDGLNGTRDYRALAGAPLFVLLVYMAFEKIFAIIGFDIGLITVLLIVTCAFIYLMPCNSRIANIMSFVFHTNLLAI